MALDQLKRAVPYQHLQFCYHYVECHHRETAAEKAGYCKRAVAKRNELFEVYKKILLAGVESEELIEAETAYKKEKSRVNQLLANAGYNLLKTKIIKELCFQLSEETVKDCLKNSVIARLVKMIFFDPTEMLQLAESANGNQAKFFRLLNATDQGQYLTECKVTTTGDINIKWSSAIAAVDRLSKLMGWDISTLDVKASVVDEDDVLHQLTKLVEGVSK
jgi:hypothetical protein